MDIKTLGITIGKLIVITLAIQIVYMVWCVFDANNVVKQFNEEVAIIVAERNCLPSEYIPELESIMEEYEDRLDYIKFGQGASIIASNSSAVVVTDDSGNYLLGLDKHVQQGTIIRVKTQAVARIGMKWSTEFTNTFDFPLEDNLVVFGTTFYRDLD